MLYGVTCSVASAPAFLAWVVSSIASRVLLAPVVCEDADIAARLQHQETEVADFAMLEEFTEPYNDLLERQLRLILKRLTDPARS